jgi:TonB-linked SusC/RagA family outer membrane protein
MNNFKYSFLLWILSISFVFAQQTVTGLVTDDQGFPLPGATILEVGTSNGTTTDFDGNFTIEVGDDAFVSISYVGYQTLTLASNADFSKISLSSSNALDEVVVTSFGVTREKKSLGYSQQSVGGDQLTKARETDIANALAGKIAGVQIVGNNSSTFGASAIRLRGSDDVLYVVDGVRIYATSDINTDNVADISVLKGASATALYGPEGRNGVIIITSKKAEKGKAVIELDQSIALNQVSALPEYQNEYGGGYSQSFNVFNYDPAVDPASWASFDGDLYPDFWADESWGPRLDGTLVRHWDSWAPDTPEFGVKRPWSPTPNDVKDFYEDALTSNTTLSFSKAEEDYNIRTAISYIDQNGIIPNSKNNVIRFNLNLSYNITDKFTFITNVNVEDREMLNNPDQGYANLGSNFNQWWQRQLDFDRLKEYERGGNVVSWNIRGPRDPRPLYWDMPYFQSYENYRNWNKNSSFGKVEANYEFSDKLSAKVQVRKTFHSYLEDDRATTISLLDPAFYSEFHGRNERTDFYGMLSYKDSFLNDELTLNASLGAEKIEETYRILSSSTVGNLTIPDFYNLAGSKDPVSSSNTLVGTKRDGLFLTASAGYKGFLYLDGSYRFDWNSTANPDANRIETIGSSLSFLAHELLPANQTLSFFKIRAGYAEAPLFPDPYKISAVYGVGSLYQGSGRLSVASQQENANLTGGVRAEFEVGTELQLFDSKIGLDISYFDRNDTDIPILVPLDGSTGYSSIIVNSGKQTSNGLEIGLFGDVISGEDFNWELGINFATYYKFVDALYEGIDSRDLSSYTSNMLLQERVGEEWGALYGRGFTYDASGNMLFRASGDNYYYSRTPNKYLGNVLPDFTGGVTSNMSYKNFDLTLGFDFQKGGKYYSRTERYLDHSGLPVYTAGLNDKGNPLRDPVSQGGGVHIQGVLETGADANGNPISDGTVVDAYVDPQNLYNLGNLGNIYENNLHDASYIKLRTVRLSYRFDTEFVNSLNIDGASISFFANNLWLIDADLNWIDPSELEKRSGINWAEAGTLPRTRSMGMNLKLTF